MLTVLRQPLLLLTNQRLLVLRGQALGLPLLCQAPLPLVLLLLILRLLPLPVLLLLLLRLLLLLVLLLVCPRLRSLLFRLLLVFLPFLILLRCGCALVGTLSPNNATALIPTATTIRFKRLTVIAHLFA